MKRTFLALSILLLSAGGVWGEEDEFPMKLTCDIPPLIMYFNITKEAETTWRQNHSANQGGLLRAWNGEKYPDRYPPRDLEISNNFIKLKFREKGALQRVHINRLNGTISILVGTDTTQGHCTKGFKKYKDRKF